MVGSEGIGLLLDDPEIRQGKRAGFLLMPQDRTARWLFLSDMLCGEGHFFRALIAVRLRRCAATAVTMGAILRAGGGGNYETSSGDRSQKTDRLEPAMHLSILHEYKSSLDIDIHPSAPFRVGAEYGAAPSQSRKCVGNLRVLDTLIKQFNWVVNG